MKTVLFFGTFDPIHAGHRNAFVQARSLGDRLIVVVARDTTINAHKKREAHFAENERLAIVAADSVVDEAILGDSDSSSYSLLSSIPFDILALGYDQKPSDEEVRLLLNTHGLSHVGIVRLSAYEAHTHKSSLLRPS